MISHSVLVRCAFAGAVVIALATIVTVNAASLSLVRLPKPSGAWSIGRTTITLGGGLTDIWYPVAKTATGKFAAYGTKGDRSIKQRVVGHIVFTSALLDASPAQGRFPTIVFLPGWGGRRESNTVQIQNLASHGYVVAAIDDRHRAADVDFSSAASLATSVVRAERKLDAQVDDVLSLIDDLARLDHENDSIARHFDLSSLGIVGFSFGGAVAAEAARRDPRIRAAVNLDGYMYGGAYRTSVTRPFLYMSTGDGEPADPSTLNDQARRVQTFDREQGDRIVAGLHQSGGYFVAIDGSEHSSFTDSAALPSWLGGNRAKLAGIDGARLIGTCIVDFLDRTRRGTILRPPDFNCGSPIVHVLAAYAVPSDERDGAVVQK